MKPEIILIKTRHEIAGGSNLSIITFNLINWAESKAYIKKLVIGLYNENPNNIRIKSFLDLIN